MGRLIDSIRSKHTVIHAPFWDAKYMLPAQCTQHSEKWKGMINAVGDFVFEATNVCEYFFRGTDQEFWDPAKDFPCMAPPAYVSWIEYGRPSGIRSTNPNAEKEFNREQMPPKTGCLVVACARGEANFSAFNDRYRCQLTGRPFRGVTRPVSGSIDDAAMIVMLELFFGVSDEDVVGPIGEVAFWLDKNYDVIDYVMLSPMYFSHTPEEEAEILQQIVGMDNMVYPTMLTLTMLNLNNVRIEQVDPHKKASHRNHHIARHGVPLAKYRTLLITPFKESVRKSQVASAKGTRKQAFGDVRGHIIRSGVDGRKHLFGNPKVVGRFWVGPFTRGDKEVGVVAHEYKVEVEKK